MILDTSSAIRRVRENEEITGNLTILTLIEFPPIAAYGKFRGKIYLIREEDQIKAIELQERLRKIGKPMSATDLLIASMCINRNEELLTLDRDFLVIREVEPLFRVLID
ncbi:MAG: hypothetical protein QXP51_06060 [Candidatus Hadarchaeales archaeon]